MRYLSPILPWLNKLVNDINLGYVSYVGKIGERQGYGLAMRYFSLGEINFRDEGNNPAGTGQPYEMTINGAYSLKLSEQMSLAVGLRWIYSDLLNGATSVVNTEPGQSFAADVGYYYESREFNMEGGRKQSFALGASSL
ncbi:MAG: PorV/PorQ family protein [Owenweeksia sp.]|nr:PorV/PorQ family protein [Owenweeksia sp.]